MADNAPLDENSRQGLIAASSADGKTPVRLWADPDSHRLLVDQAGGVVGPGTSTDNAVVRWDGTTGETIQNSTVIITDAGAVTGVTTVVASSTADFSGYKVGGVSGATGTFTTVDLKTVTVTNGIIVSIV